MLQNIILINNKQLKIKQILIYKIKFNILLHN